MGKLLSEMMLETLTEVVVLRPNDLHFQRLEAHCFVVTFVVFLLLS